MKTLFDVKEVDRTAYAERVRDFLPDDIIDIHTHVWRAGDFTSPGASTGEPRTVTWPSRVAAENPIGDLLETYRLLFPGKRVTPLIFATLPDGTNLDAQNAYVAACSRSAEVPGLIFSDPTWSADELERRIVAGGFVGAKSYLTMAPTAIPARDISVLDFFPPHQLEVHNRHGWIVMLHLPRDGRLKDPVNLEHLVRIERDYPNLALVVAHVGRAYCDEDVGNAFEVLAGTTRLSFDFSANTNERVFARMLECVGPKRVLFGSDLPILRMRMRRIIRDGRYINLVPRGLYGDVSGDRNMGEVDGPEAERLTFFMYEEIDAFRRAAERVGLTRGEVSDVFCGNARRLLASAGWRWPVVTSEGSQAGKGGKESRS